MRIGFGYDVHKLVGGRKLILGGELIDYPFGLDGHSDADVVVHALMDAMLGALALGDIGTLFPDSDPKYKDVSSMHLLKIVHKIITDNGYCIGNADITIAAQEPKILPYSIRMRSNIAEALKVDISRINIKATTEENLGFTGRREGVKCCCVCLLDKIQR